MGKHYIYIIDIKFTNIFMYNMMIDDYFDFCLTIVDHIVGHLEIIIQVRFICPLDPVYILLI
jgi:hypothetical protein